MVALDAGSERAVEALIAKIAADHGGLDIVFANAGISGGLAGIFEQSAEDWAEVLRVNLIGPFLAIKYAAPLMQQRGGGSIICTASVAGLRSGAGGAAYSASKAGLINLVKVAATQLAGSNVRVNAICPGLIETGMTRDIYELGTIQRQGTEARPAQPAAPRRRAGGNRRGRAVPRVGRCELYQWPGNCGGWRTFRIAPLFQPVIWAHERLNLIRRH